MGRVSVLKGTLDGQTALSKQEMTQCGAGPLLHPPWLWAHKRLRREQLPRQPRYVVMRWLSCATVSAVGGAKPTAGPCLHRALRVQVLLGEMQVERSVAHGLLHCPHAAHGRHVIIQAAQGARELCRGRKSELHMCIT